MIYCENIRIRYSEVGENGMLTPVALVNYLQDITMIHSKKVSGDYKTLESQNSGWVLSAWQIDILKPIEVFDEVCLYTSPYDFKGGMGLRNCWIEDEKGQKLVVANSYWTFIDLEKLVPQKITKEVAECYEPLCEKIDMEYLPRKIKIPDMVENREQIEVKYNQIDTNHHVNNCQYIATALEVLGINKIPSRIRTEYKKAAVMGDVFYPCVARTEDGYVVDLRNGEGTSYAVVAFEYNTL